MSKFLKIKIQVNERFKANKSPHICGFSKAFAQIIHFAYVIIFTIVSKILIGIFQNKLRLGKLAKHYSLTSSLAVNLMTSLNIYDLELIDPSPITTLKEEINE